MLRRMLVLAALLAVPSLLSAQERGQRGGGRGGMMGGPNPIEIVLGKAADLKLTADQTTKLEAINKTLVETNKPIMDEITKMRESGTMDREAMMAHAGKLRANNDEARGKLKDVLNAEQLAAAEKFIQEATPGRRGGG